MKITKNFSYWEFGPKGCNKSWVPGNDYQKMLINNLANGLQVLRDTAPAKISISITSGVRTIEDYYRLQGSGYNPSSTSDHFCGNAVPIQPTDSKYKKFGPNYIFSTGAADTIPTGMKVYDYFIHAMKSFVRENVKFGQIIYEKNPKTKAEWVHISGPYSNYFSQGIVTWLDKKPFLKSLDGGKTYTTAAIP